MKGIRITPLYNIHSKLGATFDVRHEDWKLPAKFTDPITEHNAVRNNVGIADVSYLGTLRLTGEDRAKFLHRLISNDVENLSDGEGNYATLLTNRGKIIGDLRVYVFNDTIYISTAPENVEQVFTELDKYIIADDVELSVETENVGTIGVYGPNSPELLQSALGIDEASTLPEYHSVYCEIEDRRVGCVRTNIVGECGYHIYTSATTLAWLWEKLTSESDGVVPIGWDAAESLRIEAGTPRYGAELTDSVIPLEAELEHAIDFEKGCYIGQEIVARMKYRGHPNRLLRGLVIDGEKPAQQNAPIYNEDKKIGWVTSSAYSPTLSKPIALAYVRMVATEPGSEVQIQISNELVSAKVVVLPFTFNGD